MFASLRRRPGHATVIAYLALFVALGGTAYAANEWTGENIVDGSLTAVDLKDNTLGGHKIKDHSLQAVDMAPGAIGATELAPDAVSSGNVVDGSIASADVQDETLTSADIAPNAIGSSEIATDAVNATEIADNSIDTGEVQNGGLTVSDLAGAHKDGSLTFSANAVANGRCRDFVVSSSGSKVGDAVVLSIKGALADGMLVMGVRVEVDNQAIMKLCNFTGGASPAINDLPVKLLTFR